MEELKAVRINKYLSEIGYCSRRAADKLIDEGRITVNGKPVEMGMKVTANDNITVDGEAVNPATGAFYRRLTNRQNCLYNRYA